MPFSPWRIEIAIKEDDISYFSEFYESGEWLRLGISGEAAMLYSAAEKGARKIYMYLLDKGVNINEDYNGFTALCAAAAAGDIEGIKAFLQRGARLNGNADTICPPLHTAILYGHTEAARLFIEAGANVNRSHLWSAESSLDMARRYNCPEIEELLLMYGAKSTYELPDCPPGEEREYLKYILENTGRISLDEYSASTECGPLKIRMAVHRSRQKKLLFTWGISQHTSPKAELFSEMPMEWRFALPEKKNKIATQCLISCAGWLESGKSLEEGQFFSAASPLGREISWPSNRMGIKIFKPRYYGDIRERLGISLIGAEAGYLQSYAG